MSEDTNGQTTTANFAATKIQANFRGYRVRKQLKESQHEEVQSRENKVPSSDVIDREEEPYQAKCREDCGTRVPNTPTHSSLDAREALEEKSATKIQAGVRGFLVRKRQQTARTAATRIQAGFRGFRTRKLLKQNGQ